EQGVEGVRRVDRLKGLEVCLIAPAGKPGWRKAFFVCAGGVCAARSLPPGAGARLEINAGLTLCRLARDQARETLTLTEAEDLLLLAGFVRRPPPELAVLPLDARKITAHLVGGEHQRAASTGAWERSADPLRELDDDPLWAADVAEPVDVFVVLHLSDELAAPGSRGRDSGVDVLDLECDVAEAKGVRRRVPVSALD